MLGLGFWEIVIIGLIALIVVGPDKLPEFAKSVAKFLNEMKRTASDFKSAIDQEKDVFKEEIDRFQKLSQELQSFPEENSNPNTALNQPEQLELLPMDENTDFHSNHTIEINKPNKDRVE